MRKILTLFVLPLSAALAAAQDGEPTNLRPTGAWALEEQFARCTIERRFGPSEQPSRLIFERGPAPLNVIVRVQRLANDDFVAPDRITVQPDSMPPQMSEVRPVSGDRGNAEEFISTFGALNDVPGTTSATTVRLSRGDRTLMQFEFGGLGAALAALRDCQDRRYSDWGVDAAMMRRVHVDAIPAGNPASWVRADDMPPQFQELRSRLTTATALELGADGRVVRCTVIATSGQPLLDLLACRVFTARARFTPARDAAGRAVPTVVARNVAWQGTP